MKKNVKSMIKNNQGFSLVELLIALLIMAVIAAAAITMFTGVLNTSKSSTDKETAENIRKAISTYMNASNDTKLIGLGAAATGANANTIIDALKHKIVIHDDKKVFYCVVDKAAGTIGTETDKSLTCEATAVAGSYGPLLDVTKATDPQEPKKAGWNIVVDSESGLITVTSVAAAADAKITVNN